MSSDTFDLVFLPFPEIESNMVCSFCAAVALTLQAAPAVQEPIGIFEVPARFAAVRDKLRQCQMARQAGNAQVAEQAASAAVRLMPDVPETLTLLAAVQAESRQHEKALVTLQRAVAAGLNDLETLQNPRFAPLREMPGWAELLEAAKNAQGNPNVIFRRPAQPATVKGGVATIAPDNTQWVGAGNVLLSLFSLPEDNQHRQIVRAEGKVGELLRRWQSEGTAAGNHGDFYDNRDRDHSNMKYAAFPQLTRVEYCHEARVANLDYGAQLNLLIGGVVLGNSSTSLTTKRIWRSQPRLIASDSFAVAQAYNQYVNNHIYVYPEHRDYDVGHNGYQKGGYGDVYFANMPFFITSQGSSGSDRPFLKAIAATLAAFRPEVKESLISHKRLMPTVQMIFRRSNKNIATDEDYLSGRAHPPVFDSANLDTQAMVRLAHSITEAQLPPLAKLRVTAESSAVGADRPEIVFNTPAAVCRVHRTTDRTRFMKLDASASSDANGLPLTYVWKVLTGDTSTIEIRPLNESGSQVELRIPWHARRPIAEGSPMKTNRVDIALFVSNGRWYSAPAIVSTYFPDNETRIYDADGRLRSRTFNRNYADPVLVGGAR